MPKRVLDFDALWASDKIDACAEWAQPEYAWVHGFADANGSFELTNLRVLWAKAYAIRKNFPLDLFERVIQEFNDKGLLFIWTENRKRYGFWTGSDKPGRLPRESRRTERYGRLLAPPVPKDELQTYTTRCASQSVAAELPKDNCDTNAVARVGGTCDGNPVVGLGLGIGMGVGVKTTALRRQKPAPGDLRFQHFIAIASESFTTKHGRQPLWQGKDFSSLKRLLKSQAPKKLPLDRLMRTWNHFAASTERFTAMQGDSLAYFCSNIDKFSDGPLLATPLRGGANGKCKDINEAVATTMHGAAINAGITH